jgi:Sel1 repeat
MYEFGIGTKQDFVKAEEFYVDAATRGDALACGRLSFLRKYGRPGVRIDRVEAEVWANRVAELEAGVSSGARKNLPSEAREEEKNSNYVVTERENIQEEKEIPANEARELNNSHTNPREVITANPSLTNLLDIPPLQFPLASEPIIKSDDKAYSQTEVLERGLANESDILNHRTSQETLHDSDTEMEITDHTRPHRESSSTIDYDPETPIPTPPMPDFHTAITTTSHQFLLYASQYLPAALYALGVNHHDGIGTPRSPRLAVHYYTLAAAAGQARGEGILGYCYGEGFGVPKDECRAFGLYMSAALKGESVSMYNVAHCYEGNLDLSRYLKLTKTE